MLLDTHTLIWFLNDDAKLSKNAKTIIEDGDDLFISIISIWEMAIKISVGKLNIDIDFANLPQILTELDIHILQFDFTDTEIYIGLPLLREHKDPFDRMIVVQAIRRSIVLVSADKKLDTYLIKRVWE